MDVFWDTVSFFPDKLTTFFCSSLSLLLISLGCHPLEGVTRIFFCPSDLICPLFFVNLATIFFFGVTPLKGVTREGPPPSDATV